MCVNCHVCVWKLSCICVYHFRLDFGTFLTVLNCLDFNLYSSFKSGTFVFSKVSWQVHTTLNIPLTYFVNALGLKNVKWLETDHLTCRGGGGGVCFFVSFKNFFSDNTRVRICICYPEFNIRLYDKISESDFFFFPSIKIRIFFSATLGIRICFLEKKHNILQSIQSLEKKNPHSLVLIKVQYNKLI